jgi:hypothetical protein
MSVKKQPSELKKPYLPATTTIKIDEFVFKIWNNLKKNNRVTGELIWGGNWNFKDYPHFEIK